MALADKFKNIIGSEVKELKSVLERIRYGSAGNEALGVNFRRFGLSFGVYDFDGFLEKAREFYRLGIDSDDPRYTVVEMTRNRIAVDFDCEVRGIYTHTGEPLAFFRPDYRQAGYSSKKEEFEDFARGKDVLTAD